MLMIDIGNSRIKYGTYSNAAWQSLRSHFYQIENIEHQFDLIFQDIPSQPVYVACVVDAMKEPVVQWFASRWGLKPLFVVAKKQSAGVTNSYEKPDKLGVDRWLAMVAAYNKFGSAVCVIDCGTAVTVDVIDESGLHRGGLIMPGLQLMRESLFSNASKIKSTKGRVVALANNTEDAVESGCVRLLSSGLDQICQELQDKYSGLRLIITGGDGEFVARQMRKQTTLIETLVLDGLCVASSRDC